MHASVCSAITCTGLLGEDPGGWNHLFSGTTIEVDHEKRVDLEVLRGADHDGRVPFSPFSTVLGVCVIKLSSSRLPCNFGDKGTQFLDSAPSI